MRTAGASRTPEGAPAARGASETATALPWGRRAADPRFRVAAAAATGLLVLAVTLWARTPYGAGVYYDDGVYLALARSLAEGEGYRYANLPGAPPGAKYPPLYPVVLAGAWKAFGPYPDNLPALKAVNAVLWAGAASLACLLFAGGSRRGAVAVAAVTAYGFLAAPSLSIATALLSEPLFLLLSVGALCVAGGGAGGVDATGPPARPLLRWLAAGSLAAAAFLTRAVGLSLVAAVAGGAALARPGRGARRSLAAIGVAAAAPALAIAGWSAWTERTAGAVPAAAAGHYGAYAGWYLEDAAGAPAGRLLEIAGHGAGILVETLRHFWAPGAPGWAAAVILLALGGCAAIGGAALLRRRPAVPLFVLFYLGIVLLWPYEPYRFFWTIAPLLTLLAAEGVATAWGALRRDLPRVGPALAAVALGAVALNAGRSLAAGFGHRAWEIPQSEPARVFAPLADWIRGHTPPDAVVASQLDPYFYWRSGRRGVPAWIFRASDFGREERDPERLAADLEAIRAAFDPDYLAVVRSETKAYLTAVSYAERHPGRIEVVHREEGDGREGIVYRFVAAATPPTPR